MAMSSSQQGYIFAIITYCIWGLSPVYFKSLQEIPAAEILTHRIIWSFFFMLILISFMANWSGIKKTIRNFQKIKWLLLSAVTIGVNWLIYIWAINNDKMLEASMGYFIAPLVSMFSGMLFFKERFCFKEWLALFLALCAVLIQVVSLGQLPLVGLGLAFSMTFYSVIRKKIAIDSQTGMLIETAGLLPLALIYLLFIAQTPSSNLVNNSWSINLLLVCAGIITTTPLLFFTAATTRLPLSRLGFFQYIGPTLTFLLAVFVYNEKVARANLISFSLIWLALALFLWQVASKKH